jgi:predicted  nucleic acid-binding Zn-ribbon protein
MNKLEKELKSHYFQKALEKNEDVDEALMPKMVNSRKYIEKYLADRDNESFEKRKELEHVATERARLLANNDPDFRV